MSRRILLALAAAAAFLPATARADRSFILPSGTLFSGSNNVVTFDAAGSEHLFFFDHRPIQVDGIRVTRPDGSAGETAAAITGRLRSVFDVRLDQPGTWKIATRQQMVFGSFKQNGEERRVGGRGGPPPGGAAGPGGAARPAGGPGGPGGAGAADGAPRQPGAGGPGPGPGPGGPGGPDGGPRRQPPVAVRDIPADATDVKLTEIVNTIETFVTQGAPTTGTFKTTGQGLEIDPVTHPNAAAAGEVARFRFLIDGKPAAGVKVTAIPGGDRYREDAGAIEQTTGADGTVAIKWPTAGMWWLGASAEDAHPSESRAQTRRMTYALTVEVATP